ncbi:predicted protein [Postia placenta Mad-698-R]|nr:predicted protein [Postia placenta Mad-698-R]
MVWRIRRGCAAEMAKKINGHRFYRGIFGAVSEDSSIEHPNNRTVTSQDDSRSIWAGLQLGTARHAVRPDIFLLHFLFQRYNYSEDIRLVGALFLAEWLQTIFTTIGILHDVSLSFFMWFLWCPIIATAVQIYYAWRISVLSDWKSFRYLAAMITLVAVGSLVTCITATVLGLDVVTLVVSPQMPVYKYLASISPVLVWLSLTAFVDIVIAILMTILLYRIQSHSVATAGLKTSLIQYTITSGAITASVALVAFALYMTDVLASDLAFRGVNNLGPYNSWAVNYPGPLSICPYANTALFGLNNRSLLRQKYNDSEQTIMLPTIDSSVPSDTQESHRSILAFRSSHQGELAANTEQDIQGPW